MVMAQMCEFYGMHPTDIRNTRQDDFNMLLSYMNKAIKARNK
jgi:hypothetical protein